MLNIDVRDLPERGADLSKANLDGADLSKARLDRAVLVNASLHEARLDEADLTQADLGGADLSDAFLRWTNLWNCRTTYLFVGAHLSVSAGQPFGMPLSAENDVGGVIGRLMFGDAVAERW